MRSNRGTPGSLPSYPTPESKSVLKDELATCLSEAELQKVMAHRGDKEALILSWQYQAVGDLHGKGLIGDSIFFMLTNALDDLVRLQGATKRIKNYPYARNYYSITVLLVIAFVANCPVLSLSLFSRPRNADRDRTVDGVVERSLQPAGRLDFRHAREDRRELVKSVRRRLQRRPDLRHCPADRDRDADDARRGDRPETHRDETQDILFLRRHRA